MELPFHHDVEVVGLLAAPVHRYDGRPDAGTAALPVESQESIEVRADLGVVGDRYFARPAHRDASVTVLAVESLEELATELGSGPWDPLAARRNVVLRGAEVEALRGQSFSLDCGAGEVHLDGGRPANPCAWMDLVLGPGAHRGMRGRGGVRCRPRTDGVLRLGPAVLRSAVPLDAARAGAAVRPAARRPA
ncbi:MOSC domain-containing protein [Modestobacter sp. VKM Ac-2986]|uniref:MOSC domain-containing protein n=1 Tax=Modestobacter sp. VKM Ac-2986 TaxID=3004140 RepID=UPI0022AA1AFA|nr:MOSC domain-containing protein [Modestobacter sp. VKM Ac-2986]MCZ2827553.1 MOSC domain-containing protein [Modestobacter sp. VKM Ac-2986]